jgi:hypothetical protein
MCYAREWSRRSCNTAYVETIRALIAEETRHARDLAVSWISTALYESSDAGPIAYFAGFAM